MVNLAVLIPLYIYPYIYNPSPVFLWQPLIDVAKSHPDVTFQVVINPNDGPGGGDCPDPYDYTPAIAALNALPNIQTFGYVHTANRYDCGPYHNYICTCSQPISAVQANITKYAHWNSGLCSTQDVHVDGIFFDESPGKDGGECLEYMRNLTEFARNTGAVDISKGGKAFLNPGYSTEDVYFKIGSFVKIVVFEGEASTFYGFSDRIFKREFLNGGTFATQSYVILTNESSGNSTLKSDVKRLGSALKVAGAFINNLSTGDYTKFGNLNAFVGHVDALNKGNL